MSKKPHRDSEAPEEPGKKPLKAKSPETSKVAMHKLLADKLRTYYDQVASEPVPDRFQQLLQKLEAKNRK